MLGTPPKKYPTKLVGKTSIFRFDCEQEIENFACGAFEGVFNIHIPLLSNSQKLPQWGICMLRKIEKQLLNMTLNKKHRNGKIK